MENLMKLMASFWLGLVLVGCGADDLARHENLNLESTPPEAQEEIEIDGMQEGMYSVMGMSAEEAAETKSTSYGSWCGGSPKAVLEFRCGLGNPGSEWVLQPDGCYHRRTATACNCEVGPDWYDDATYECQGSNLHIVDSCGYDKLVTNHPSCFDTIEGINTFDRAAVVRAYNDLYRKPVPAMEWSGNKSTCEPGSTSLAFQQRVIDQINFYRMMTGLKPVTLTPTNSNYQAAALIMDANYRLSHYPDESWQCYSQAGANGARSSNLALGTSGPSAIDLYMDDPGSGNGAVGHRRWILYPPQSTFATGDTPRSNSLAVFLSGRNSYDVEYVAWPSRGFFPYQLLPGSRSYRWSFSLPNANFTNASVSVRNITSGQSYTIKLEPIRDNYGWDTLVFIPEGLSTSRPSRDTVYEVKINNVRVGTTTKSFTYRVTVIDP